MENQMENGVENRMVAMGGKIYSLRVAKGMTQEQLAGVLCISPAAISKWERNLANPNIEMLWALADFFDCSIDELVGRKTKELDRAGEYDKNRLCMVETAEELLTLSEISRQQGLLALEGEMKQYQGECAFLKFAVKYFIHSMMEQIAPGQIVGMLNNYAKTLLPSKQAEGRMVAEVLGMIVSGERRELVLEACASHIGVGYREKIGSDHVALKREELLEKYQKKAVAGERTGLLEKLSEVGDFEIQVLLRNLDNATLTAALCGASGAVVTKFLKNLSDWVLVFLCEDMENFKGGEEEMAAAQQRVLELFCNMQGGDAGEG